MSTFGLLLVIAAVVWFWMEALRARERVLRVCASACKQMDVQLLDQTVSLSRLSLRRGASGKLRFARTFGFEYSTNGADRWPGRALLLGRRVESVQLDRADGVLILPGGKGEWPDAQEQQRH